MFTFLFFHIDNEIWIAYLIKIIKNLTIFNSYLSQVRCKD